MRKKRLKLTPSPFLSYVPDLLPDELLYSLLGRLTAYNAFTNPREYLTILFGTKNIIPSVDLPTALRSLQQQLDRQSPFKSVEQMIDAATLYPYHRPFLTPERHDRVHSILLKGGGKGLKILLGRVANRFGANPPLRYCPACCQDDTQNHSYPYWHRVHQLPGITSCAIHGIDLVAYISPSESTDRQKLQLVPTTSNRGRVPKTESASSQVAFAKISSELLAMNLPVLGTSRWQGAYTMAASQNGFADANGRIIYDRLVREMLGHYSEFSEFQHQRRILSTPKQPLGWLRTIFERPDRSSHPIFHLLLIGFFFGTVKAFADSMVSVQGWGDSTQNDDKSTAIDLAIQRTEAQTATLLKDESLSSRTVASILGVSVNTVVSRRRAMGVKVSSRRKRLNDRLLITIEKALISGESPSAVAQKLGVSLTTVYRIRRESPPVLAAQLLVRADTLRSGYRSRWEKAITRSSRSGIGEIRRKDPAAYAWLYRNDKEWLMASLKHLASKRPSGQARIDWNARDGQLCERLKEVYNNLRSEDRGSRISKTTLLRPLGEATVTRNLRRLPMVGQMLVKMVESREDFQRFRVNRSINHLLSKGIPLSLWRIQRNAGIKQWSHDLRNYAAMVISKRSDGTPLA